MSEHAPDGAAIVRVYLVDGTFKAVKYDEFTTVGRVLQVLLDGICVEAVAHGHFALRLLVGPSLEAAIDQSVWLVPTMLVVDVPPRYSELLGRTPGSHVHRTQRLKFELRMRFMPSSCFELMLTERRAFAYLHDQLFHDYIQHAAWKMELEPAIELAALRVCAESPPKSARSRVCGDPRAGGASDACAPDESLLEAALVRLVPETTQLQSGLKPVQIRRQLASAVKKHSHLQPQEAALHAIALLAKLVDFETELFRACLGAGWNEMNAVDVAVGPSTGVAWSSKEVCSRRRLADLRSVCEIRVRPLHERDQPVGAQPRALLHAELVGAPPIQLTLCTLPLAESLAQLLDGYQRLHNQSESVLRDYQTVNGVPQPSLGVPPIDPLQRATSPNIQHHSHHSHHHHQQQQQQQHSHRRQRNPSGDDTPRVRREHVTLNELLGCGQFGNVYRGVYEPPDAAEPISVAVKVCRVENEPADTQQILQESHVLRQLAHDCIIQLVGVCVDAPMWLLLELAPHGELRSYLNANACALPLDRLLLYCIQVGRALAHLHSHSFVHRDVAARNVLVVSPHTVKLSDFGLSRALDYDAVYTGEIRLLPEDFNLASRGKLPIKWMAPESIRFREFSAASDVWMLGVLCWEVFSWGAKPWSGVANNDIHRLLENGERPPRPDACPPVVHDYLRNRLWCWSVAGRSTARDVVHELSVARKKVLNRVPLDDVLGVERTSTVPAVVLAADVRRMPADRLAWTIAEQQRQGEEDTLWLEEEERRRQIRQSVDEEDETERGAAAAAAATATNPLADLRDAANAVRSAAATLANAYSPQQRTDVFFELVQGVTAALGRLFVASAACGGAARASGSGTLNRELEIVEALLANDMRQMKGALLAVQQSGLEASVNLEEDEPSTSEPREASPAALSARREVVRVTGELATNCLRLLELLQTAELEEKKRVEEELKQFERRASKEDDTGVSNRLDGYARVDEANNLSQVQRAFASLMSDC